MSTELLVDLVVVGCSAQPEKVCTTTLPLVHLSRDITQLALLNPQRHIQWHSSREVAAWEKICWFDQPLKLTSFHPRDAKSVWPTILLVEETFLEQIGIMLPSKWNEQPLRWHKVCQRNRLYATCMYHSDADGLRNQWGRLIWRSLERLGFLSPNWPQLQQLAEYGINVTKDKRLRWQFYVAGQLYADPEQQKTAYIERVQPEFPRTTFEFYQREIERKRKL